MDINYFLEREQIERVRAESAPCKNSRTAHRGFADGYRDLIENYRAGMAAAAGLAPLRPLFA